MTTAHRASEVDKHHRVLSSEQYLEAVVLCAKFTDRVHQEIEKRSPQHDASETDTQTVLAQVRSAVQALPHMPNEDESATRVLEMSRPTEFADLIRYGGELLVRLEVTRNHWSAAFGVDPIEMSPIGQSRRGVQNVGAMKTLADAAKESAASAGRSAKAAEESIALAQKAAAHADVVAQRADMRAKTAAWIALAAVVVAAFSAWDACSARRASTSVSTTAPQ